MRAFGIAAVSPRHDERHAAGSGYSGAQARHRLTVMVRRRGVVGKSGVRATTMGAVRADAAWQLEQPIDSLSASWH